MSTASEQELIDEAVRIVSGETMMLPTKEHLRAVLAQYAELQRRVMQIAEFVPDEPGRKLNG